MSSRRPCPRFLTDQIILCTTVNTNTTFFPLFQARPESLRTSRIFSSTLTITWRSVLRLVIKYAISPRVRKWMPKEQGLVELGSVVLIGSKISCAAVDLYP